MKREVFLQRDFSGHIGREAYKYNTVHRGFGFGLRNESGENLIEFALAKELVIANSIFRNKDEHLIYKSGGIYDSSRSLSSTKGGQDLVLGL